MGTNFTCIGFKAENQKEFFRLVEHAVLNGSDCCPGPDACYRKWSLGNGPEMWCRVNAQREFDGMSPHFDSSTSCNVGIVECYPRRSGMVNGGYKGWIGASPDNPEAGDLQLIFDVPGFDMYPDLALPATCAVKLTGFVQKMTVFPDEAAFHAAGLPGSFPALNILRGVESFIPVGMFEKKEGEGPAAIADLSGRVMESRVMVNSFTQMKFVWTRLKTAAMELEVVGDPDDIHGNLAVGAIVRGIFWLTGTIAFT